MTFWDLVNAHWNEVWMTVSVLAAVLTFFIMSRS